MSELRLNILPMDFRPVAESELVYRLVRRGAQESKVLGLAETGTALHVYSYGRFTYVWPRPGQRVPDGADLPNSAQVPIDTVPAAVTAYAAREGAADRLVCRNFERLPGDVVRPIQLLHRQQNLLQGVLDHELSDGIGVFPVITVDRFCLGGGENQPGPVGLVLHVGLLNRLDIPLADLEQAGIELAGMRVVWRHDEECRCGPDRPTGRAGQVLGGDSRGIIEIGRAGTLREAPAQCMGLEASRAALERYFSHLRLASPRQVQDLLDEATRNYQRPRMQWNCLERLRSILNPFTVFCTTQVELAAPVIASNSNEAATPAAPTALAPLSAPVLNFRYGNPRTARGAATGLRDHGPYDLEIVDRRDSIRATILCPPAFKDGGQRLVATLSRGVGAFPGMERRYRLKSFSAELQVVDDETVRCYREAAAEVVRGGDRPDIVYSIICHDDRYAGPGQNPYLAVKALLASMDVPSQMVTIETLRQSDSGLQWAMDAIGLQSYAKIGNIPYVLHDPSGVRELVIGVGRSDLYDSQGRFSHQLFGAAAAFRQDGDFLYAGSTAPVGDRNTYEEVLARLFREFIDRFEQEQGGPPDRLVAHVFKRTGHKEVGAVQRALDGRSIQFALLHVNRDTPLWLVEARDGEIAAAGPGTIVALGECDRLLVAGDATRARSRSLHPLRLTLDDASTFRDMNRLTGQVHGFTANSWRGFHRAQEPSTILYGRLLAAKVGQLIPYGFQLEHAIAIGEQPWFL